MRRLLAAVGLAGALLASACGTTVPNAEAKLRGAGDPGPVRSEAEGAESDGGALASTTTVAGPVDGAGSGGGTGGSAPPASGTGGTIAAASGPARGVTASTITLGLVVSGGTDAIAGSLGISGGGSISIEKVVETMVADVNRSGGILGHKLALYVHAYDAATALSNPAQTIAEICADFRDDHKVFAVLASLIDPGVRGCLADIGSPLIVLGGGVSTIIPAAGYQEHGGSYLFGIDAITTERLGQLFIQSLLARKFTEPWNTATGAPGGQPAKLGLIHVDTPDTRALYAAYAKELQAQAGLRFAETLTYPQNIDDAIASSLSAVLRFRSAGVTHVFGASAFFLRVAESQGYRPRYAYLPGLGALGVENSPAPQMRGAMSVGWIPATDVSVAQDPGETPGAKACRTVMQAAGHSLAERADVAVMYAVCDAVGAFRAALTAGGAPEVSALRRGYESLGTSFPTALTFGASMGPNRHYGVDSVRDIEFDASCTCLRYTSRSNRS